MSFDRDSPIRRVGFNDAGNLIDFVSAVARQIGTIEFEINARQVDQHTPAGLFGFYILFFQLLDERAIFFDLCALLIDRRLLLFLLILLSLELIADEGTGA